MTKPGHTQEDYEACLDYAQEHEYWAMYNTMSEDGYTEDVNWRSLIKMELPKDKIQELVDAAEDVLSNMHSFSIGSPWFRRQERLRVAVDAFSVKSKTTYGHLYSPGGEPWNTK
jgi:hypothetical protein